MATVVTGGVAADVSGDGFPVVMVHGLGGTSNSYQPQMPALSAYRVIRVDLPGSGRSPVPHGEVTIESLARAVIQAARSLGVTDAHFVGHSLGTIICQRIAADEPALVSSLTLFGALTEPPEAARAGLTERARKARAEGMADIADQIAAGTLSSATRDAKPEVVAFVRESLMRQDPEGYAKTCEALAKAAAVDGRLIAAPTLLVAGENDPVAPVSMGQMLADKIAGASLSVLDRCGHWITMEKAQEAGRKLVDFLQRNQK